MACAARARRIGAPFALLGSRPSAEIGSADPPPDAGCVVAGGRATGRQRRLDRGAGTRLRAKAEIGRYADRYQCVPAYLALSAELYRRFTDEGSAGSQGAQPGDRPRRAG